MASFTTEDDCPITKGVDVLASSSTEETKTKTQTQTQTHACYSLMSLVIEHKSHAMDLLRKGNNNQGILPLTNDVLALPNRHQKEGEGSSSTQELPTAFIKLLASACDYIEFIQAATYIEENDDEANPSETSGSILIYKKDLKKLSVIKMLELLGTPRIRSSSTGEALIILLLRILKHVPIMKSQVRKEKQEQEKKEEEQSLYLSDNIIKLVISTLLDSITATDGNSAVKNVAILALSGFLSEVKDYIHDNNAKKEKLKMVLQRNCFTDQSTTPR